MGRAHPLLGAFVSPCHVRLVTAEHVLWMNHPLVVETKTLLIREGVFPQPERPGV